MTVTYKAYGSGRKITANGRVLNPCTHIINHSPDGFNWGYCGSGAAQAALAVLVHHTKKLKDDHETALQHYQSFKSAVIAGFAQGTDWQLSSEQIQQWLNHQQTTA